MRFSVDAHAIGQRLTGNEVYIRNLLQGLAALDHSSEFIAYLASNANGASAVVPKRFVHRQVSSNSFFRLGLDLSKKLREDRPDLIHVQYTAPLRCPVPVVVSVHDISFIERPEFFTKTRAIQLQLTVKRTVRKAAMVIAPSEFSRNAILRAYGLADEHITVVPIAVSPAFRPMQREHAQGQVLSRYGISAPFILTVGDLQPRKNHIGLIRAYEELIRQYPQLPQHLVIVGKRTWFADQVIDAATKSAAAARIHFTGFVNDDDLLRFYNASSMMVFPSLYEGFGLPILEAMACGRSVACSNSSAMPEVANATALLFDPSSTEQMVRSMRDILIDNELRARMERLGQQRAAAFTWEKTSRKTLEIYYRVAGASRAGTAQASTVVPVSRP
jgi:glycosyltransferase involved in cell wall biosynthesis